jgi:hypothetical protein
MDELEISGKRYVSTRRAAKEYKYHSDYIGQLIRGKKLLGRKVGRSWYVELDSLTTYFGKESAIAPSPLIAKEVVETPAPAPVQEVVVERIVERVVEKPVEVIKEAAAVVQVQAPAVEEKVFQKEVSNIVEVDAGARDSIHIPVRVRRPSFEVASQPKRTALTYVSDDEAEYLPTAQKTDRSYATTSVMPRSMEEVEDMQEEIDEAQEVEESDTNEEVFSPIAQRSRVLMPLFGIAAIGFVALLIVFGSSIFVTSHTVIEAGKEASVGYSLQ